MRRKNGGAYLRGSAEPGRRGLEGVDEEDDRPHAAHHRAKSRRWVSKGGAKKKIRARSSFINELMKRLVLAELRQGDPKKKPVERMHSDSSQNHCNESCI